MRESGDKRGLGESGCSGVKKVSADVEPRNVMQCGKRVKGKREYFQVCLG